MKFWGAFREWLADIIRPTPERAADVADEALAEIRKFLPTFLSQGSQTAFVEEIRHFVNSTQGRNFYTNTLMAQPYVFQGDGLAKMLLVNLPSIDAREGSALVLSNSCDIAPANERLFEASLCYAPILSLPRYLEALRKEHPQNVVDDHERAIRRQEITQIMFLPQIGSLQHDGIVMLDRIVSIANDAIDRDGLATRRMFSLSDFGAWLLTLKLSIHFCRIRDRVDRVAGVVG